MPDAVAAQDLKPVVINALQETQEGVEIPRSRRRRDKRRRDYLTPPTGGTRVAADRGRCYANQPNSVTTARPAARNLNPFNTLRRL